MHIHVSLVDKNGKPEGGRWSFDAENRQHARDVVPPAIPWFEPDALTRSDGIPMPWSEMVTSRPVATGRAITITRDAGVENDAAFSSNSESRCARSVYAVAPSACAATTSGHCRAVSSAAS